MRPIATDVALFSDPLARFVLGTLMSPAKKRLSRPGCFLAAGRLAWAQETTFMDICPSDTFWTLSIFAPARRNQ